MKLYVFTEMSQFSVELIFAQTHQTTFGNHEEINPKVQSLKLIFVLIFKFFKFFFILIQNALKTIYEPQ